MRPQLPLRLERTREGGASSDSLDVYIVNLDRMVLGKGKDRGAV